MFLVLGLSSYALLTSNSKQQKLFQAIEDFKDRIIPVFLQAERQTKQITSIHANLTQCQHEKDDLAASLEQVNKELINRRATTAELEKKNSRYRGQLQGHTRAVIF